MHAVYFYMPCVILSLFPRIESCLSHKTFVVLPHDYRTARDHLSYREPGKLQDAAHLIHCPWRGCSRRAWFSGEISFSKQKISFTIGPDETNTRRSGGFPVELSADYKQVFAGEVCWLSLILVNGDEERWLHFVAFCKFIHQIGDHTPFGHSAAGRIKPLFARSKIVRISLLVQTPMWTTYLQGQVRSVSRPGYYQANPIVTPCWCQAEISLRGWQRLRPFMSSLHWLGVYQTTLPWHKPVSP